MELPLWNHPGFESVDALMLVMFVFAAAWVFSPLL